MKRNIIKVLSGLCIGIGLLSNYSAANASTYGWTKSGDKWKYYSNSTYNTGWTQIDNKWYWFDNDGVMLIGWIYEGTGWYYLYNNGTMAHDTWIGDYYLNSSGVWNPNAKQIQYSTVPDLFKLDTNSAKDMLSKYKLKTYVEEKEVRDKADDGKVLSQSIQGVKVEQGSTITIVVGKYVAKQEQTQTTISSNTNKNTGVIPSTGSNRNY